MILSETKEVLKAIVKGLSPISIVIFGSAILKIIFILFLSSSALAGSYLNSAHGNTTYGVKRNVTQLSGYAKGNCAHCHEQHASIDGVEPEPSSGNPSSFCLFADNFSGASSGAYSQSDDFCFYCHIGTGSYQVDGITNNDYSATFGGAAASVTSIMDAFNQLSYHNLKDVYDFIVGNKGSHSNFDNFTSSSNPCSGCHNPHLVKRNKAYPTDPNYTPISKPSVHDQLWGDDTNERMNSYYSGHYQAPYYCNSTSTFEPGGTTTYDGSNMPDYATFCTDCHNNTNTISSTTLGRNLYKIDWKTTGGESGGDKHGKNSATVGLNIKDPFASSSLGISIGFVVSCLDCHEPHGSPNVMLVRREVNGGDLSGNITSFDSSNWPYLCSRCHKDDSYYGGYSYKFRYVHHLDSDAPYPNPGMCGNCHSGSSGKWGKSQIACYHCHFHGADDSWYSNLGGTPTNRRTF